MPDPLQFIISLVKISIKFDHMSVGYIQKAAKKQSKIVLCAGMKIFEISKLKTYKSDISMKLGPHIYLLNTFNIPKHYGINKWGNG